MRNALICLFLAAGLAGTAAGKAHSAPPHVSVDIAPLHSIAAAIMQGAGTPDLILPPGASPHGYALRPSQAGKLAEADIVIWAGPDLAPWMSGPVAALAERATVLDLAQADSVVSLAARSGGAFEHHAHDDDMHDSGEPQAGAAAVRDPHVWLDPRNGAAFAEAIAAALAERDPVNAALYRRNADSFRIRTAALEAEIDRMLEPVRGRGFLVFHDAYRYFEHRFDMPASSSVALHAGEMPGARRVSELRHKVAGGEIICAFSEPQMDAKLLATILEGMPVRQATLDPIGADLAPGPDLYPNLLRNLARSLATCLED